MAEDMPTAHLIHGFTGSGKTTFARTLEQSTGAVRFTNDEWMHRLCGPTPRKEEFVSLYDRVESLIWQYAIGLLERNLDVIIDSGFWTRASRDLARERVVGAGAQPLLYRITCPEVTMRRRVAARSRDVPEDSLWIDDAAFELFKARFESLDEDESFIDIDGAVEPPGIPRA